MTVASSRHGPFDGSLDRDRIAAYAHATGDRTPAVLSGLAVPAVFPVLLVFTPNEAARADLPDAAYAGCPRRCARRARHRASPAADSRRIAADLVTHFGGAHDIGRHPGRDAVRTAGPGRHRRRRTVVDDDAARPAGDGGPRHRTGRAPVSGPSAGPPTRLRQPAHRRGHHTSLCRAIRRLGGPSFRHRGRPRCWFRFRVHPRPVHDGDLHAPRYSAYWASTTPAGFSGSPCGSPRPRHWTAI